MTPIQPLIIDFVNSSKAVKKIGIYELPLPLLPILMAGGGNALPSLRWPGGCREETEKRSMDRNKGGFSETTLKASIEPLESSSICLTMRSKRNSFLLQVDYF